MAADSSDKAGQLLKRAAACAAQGRYVQAEDFYRQALAFQEATCGPESDAVGCTLNELGELCRALGRYRDAQPLYERAVSLFEMTDGANSPDVANVLNNFAESLLPGGDYARAE